jgi:myo-inositol 2-dehydrogenase/D-chiro-inositol 1-dehydrogenase
LLADPAIAAVVLATPAPTHADLVVAAARAGKAIYCEKPMAVTLPARAAIRSITTGGPVRVDEPDHP